MRSLPGEGGSIAMQARWRAPLLWIDAVGPLVADFGHAANPGYNHFRSL
jgi:hypothetical protein